MSPSVEHADTPSPIRPQRPTISLDEAIAVGHGWSDPLVVHAKRLRMELHKVKADLERELEDFSLDCSKCGLDVHWVSGLGVTPGHWSHAEPAPHGEPAVRPA
jgi:hypothetical protein